MIKTKIIYEPSGRAKEYNELAANLYSGCGHQCTYCYAPRFVHKTKDQFHDPKPRLNVITLLEKDCITLQETHAGQQIFLCFTCDPYQPIDIEYQLTRQAIQVIHNYGLNVNILTKGGRRSARDFDLLKPGDSYGTTLTLLTGFEEWEPKAAPPLERMEYLKLAHDKGVHTWASLEPVIEPMQSLKFIELAHDFVDKFKVGTLNHHPLAKTIDWHNFAIDVINTLKHYKCDYYIKKDLMQWVK